MTIGACATAGGIQALRNWASIDEFVAAVYARPEYISTLATSTPISDHVLVDFELRGCPINPRQLLDLLVAFSQGVRPRMPRHSVCVECKREGVVCVAVARGVACLGPITQAGCGAICPKFHRECFGCYGPKEQPNVASLTDAYLKITGDVGSLVRLTRNFNGLAAEFREAGHALELLPPAAAGAAHD